MAISLSKGQKINLQKSDGKGLTKIMIGLGWDVAKKKGGFFSSLLSSFSIADSDIDCDASVFLCKNGKLVDEKEDIISYKHLTHSSGAVRHMGDNLTGEGDGDDEQIVVDLTKVPAEYDRLVFVVNIFMAEMRSQHFGMIDNAFIRICDEKNQEFCRYDMVGKEYENMTALIFGEVYKHNGAWKFNAIGQATKDDDISSLARRFR